MNWIKRITLILTVGCLLCGCTKSNIIRRDDNEDLPQLSSEGILWEQVWDDFQDRFAETGWYPFVDSVNGMIDPEKKELSLFLLLNEDISAQEAADFATEAIKGFNDLISEQNPNYGASSDTSYGGYVSQCSIYVMVGLEGEKTDKSGWLLEDRIPAGEYRPVNPEAVPAAEEEGETEASE